MKILPLKNDNFGVTRWLEEPFKRDYDINGATEETVARHARLRAESPLPITVSSPRNDKF